MEKTTRKIEEYTACWYVVYTATKAERRVNKQLEQSCFETYLPLQSVVRVWNSQERKVMVPFIPRIIFVCLSKNDIEQMATFDKGAFLLEREEQYVSISIEQMKTLRDAIEQTNEPVKFLPAEYNAEAIADEQLSQFEKEAISQHCYAKYVLSIKGLGTISVEVED